MMIVKILGGHDGYGQDFSCTDARASINGDKFKEYETAGVREYWIIDPLRGDARFYRRQAALYTPASPDDSGHYQTPLLPGLRLHIKTLWQEKLPSRIETVQAVQAMLTGT